MTKTPVTDRNQNPMLTFHSNPIRHCDGVGRRGFLKAGALGLGGLTLANVLRGEDAASGLQAQQSPIIPRSEVGSPYVEFTPAANLPNVLLIGDSISEGYTLQVRELLKGKANVHRIPKNGGPARTAMPQIDEWLGDTKWDVIHFNWGLHDLMFFPPPTVDPDQYERERLEQYEKNLRTLVARLKLTGSELIWASSTPVPDEMSSPRSPPNRSAVVKQYNEVAAKVMRENAVAIDDLHAHCTPLPPKLQRSNDVHFNLDGCDFLARKVAEEIGKALALPP